MGKKEKEMGLIRVYRVSLSRVYQEFIKSLSRVYQEFIRDTSQLNAWLVFPIQSTEKEG